MEGEEVRREKSALIPNEDILLRILGRLDQIHLCYYHLSNYWDRGHLGFTKNSGGSRLEKSGMLFGTSGWLP